MRQNAAKTGLFRTSRNDYVNRGVSYQVAAVLKDNFGQKFFQQDCKNSTELQEMKKHLV